MRSEILKRAILASGLILLTLVVAVGILTQSQSDRSGDGEVASVEETHSSSLQKKISVNYPQKRASSLPEVKSPPSWQEFNREYGPDLVPEFSKQGQLLSARLREGTERNQRSTSTFNVQSSTDVRERASEILKKLKPLLKLKGEYPLKEKTLQTSPSSTQVFLNQTYQGLMVRPMGTIKVDLGLNGELLAVYSDYADQMRVINQERLSLEEAASKLPSPVPGGQKIVWVSEQQGYISYSFVVKGFEWIVDADSGKILSKKDRRQFLKVR